MKIGGNHESTDGAKNRENHPKCCLVVCMKNRENKGVPYSVITTGNTKKILLKTYQKCCLVVCMKDHLKSVENKGVAPRDTTTIKRT